MSPFAKKLAWALGLSLGLNLFLLGFGVARRVPGPPMLGPPPGVAFEREGGRPGRWLGPHAPALRAQRGEVVMAREKVAQALTAEPFDREALAQALNELREVTAKGQRKLHEVLLETAEKLPLAEREKLAHSKLLHDAPGRRPPK